MRIGNWFLKPFQLPSNTSLFLSPQKHSPAFTLTRCNLVVARIQQISTLFAVLTLCYIAVDAAFMPRAVWQQLAFNRALTSLFFILLALSCSRVSSIYGVYCRLFLLFAIPIEFLLNSNHILSFTHSGVGELILTSSYSYSPFVIASGVSLFPLTIMESLFLLGLPMMLAMSVSVIAFPAMLALNSGLSIIWVLSLILCVSILSAVSQLGFMLKLFEDTAHDSLTGLFRRHVGAAILDQQFQAAMRQKSSFTILFIDIDDLKKINDQFGHDAGDRALKDAAERLKKTIRRQDIAIRWGGDEFLIALPNTDAIQTNEFILRLIAEGLGVCADGRRVTASIGGAEYMKDNIKDLEALTNLADKRVYMAKQAGRDCHVLQDKVEENLN